MGLKMLSEIGKISMRSKWGATWFEAFFLY